MAEVSLEELKFSYFCKVCEKVRAQKSKQKAGEILEKFVDYIMKSNPPSFFPILRLLLPQLDRERGPYGVKETSLARTYKRILGLASNSSEAKSLTDFTSPSAIRTGAMGDFAEVLCCVLKNRCGEGNEMTIGEVNTCLDNIALKHAQHDPRAVDEEYATMVLKMSNMEQKWIARIVLKSMELGLGHKKILSIYHPDANQLYVLTNSIQKVCEKLKNRKIRYYELSIELFQAFRPMLCERGDVHNLSINTPHLVETKLDGERFQIHYKEGSFKYFSRNGYDYSDIYGENAHIGHFTSVISKQLSPDLMSCILDGEMMGWHQMKKKFITKAGNIDVKKLKIGSTLQPCFCAFDILLYNDVILTGKTLTERIEIINTVFTPLEGVLMHVPRSTISTTEEAFASLNNAIDNNEEGIIIKDPSSAYIPNSRKSQWRKFKPDYSEGTEDLDLLVIGGYFGSGRKKGMICHFLLGIAEDFNGEPERFMSFARVSNGLSDSELDEVSEKLSPHWVKYKEPCPLFLLLKREKPDVYINPRNSIIFQVKSPEVMKSDFYYTEYTLRFPRIERVRYDKLWSECLTCSEFTKLRTAYSGKLTVGHILPGSSRRKRKLEEPSKVSEPQIKIEKLSDLFYGKDISVMTGNNELPKSEVEKLIKQHGGSVSQLPKSSTFCILFGQENIRVRNVIKSKKHNVANISWFLECIKESRIIPWNRQNLVSGDLKTEALLAEELNAFGDDNSERLSLESLKSIFNSISIPPNTSVDLSEVDKLIFQGPSPYSIFRNYFAFFDLKTIDGTKLHDQWSLKNSEIIFKFHGGIVCDRVHELTSHIVVDCSNLKNLSVLKDYCKDKKIFCTFVSHKWIMDSHKEKILKNEEDYVFYKFDPWDG